MNTSPVTPSIACATTDRACTSRPTLVHSMNAGASPHMSDRPGRQPLPSNPRTVRWPGPGPQPPPNRGSHSIPSSYRALQRSESAARRVMAARNHAQSSNAGTAASRSPSQGPKRVSARPSPRTWESCRADMKVAISSGGWPHSLIPAQALSLGAPVGVAGGSAAGASAGVSGAELTGVGLHVRRAPVKVAARPVIAPAASPPPTSTSGTILI